MRFRADLADVTTLHRVIQTIAKVAPRCLVRVTPEEIRFICTADSGDGGVQVWSQFNNSAFFKEQVVESKYRDQIDFEVPTDLFSQALRSCDNALHVLMRLAKRGADPLLSFAIANASHTGGRMEIVQDIHIRIIRAQESARLKDPLVPDPQVHINLPKMFKVRSVAEKMRNVSRHIYISANRSEEFVLAVEEPEVRIETKWTKCGHPRINESEQTTAASASAAQSSASTAAADKTRHFRVKVDAKSLVKFLSSSIIESQCVACICEGFCVIFYVYLGGTQNTNGVMTFYLPGTEED